MIFENVTVEAKANIYFDGKVVSHAIQSSGGERKTLGLIHPGSYHFGTDAAERMEIVSGDCQVTMDGEQESKSYEAGESFEVPASSGFTIRVKDCICEYVCSLLPAELHH